MNSTLETCRHWYNTCLAERRDAYQQRGETVGKYQQLAQVKVQKATKIAARAAEQHAG